MAAVISNREEMLGKAVPAAADYYTPARVVAEFEEITGKKAQFV